MKAEFTLDLCFIRLHVSEERFSVLIENELMSLFSGIGQWKLNERQEGQLDIALAEVNGIWNWESEAMVLAYLELKASIQFWEWLQGFKLSLELKEAASQSFCHLKPRAAFPRGEDLHELGTAAITV